MTALGPDRPFWIAWAVKGSTCQVVRATESLSDAERDRTRMLGKGYGAGIDPVPDVYGRMPKVQP